MKAARILRPGGPDFGRVLPLEQVVAADQYMKENRNNRKIDLRVS